MTIPSNEAERLMVYINPERCTGCRSCEIACAVEKSKSKSLYEAIFERPAPKPRTKVIVAELLNVPARCQHCEDAPCLSVCPTSAIEKTQEGFITLNERRCIGCLMCVIACPFGHPRYEREYKSALKCDLCAERVRRGDLPACVEACPTEALLFGTVEEVTEIVKRESLRGLLQGLKAPEVVIIKGEKGESKLPNLYMAYSRVRWY